MSEIEDSRFYEGRHLGEPVVEHRPGSPEELRELVEGSEEAERAMVILGGGEHLRASALGERSFDVVRTDRCNRLRGLDLDSNTARVEAGLTWSGLQEKLAKKDRSVQRYGLYPANATIGGLLARWQPLEKQLNRGDVRDGCIALRTASPAGADYSYLAAPRKASGPDSRFLYVGGEGALGVILEATLVVQPRFPGRLLAFEAASIGAAVAAFRRLARLDMRATWCRWCRSEEVFEAAMRAPDALLDGYMRRLRSETKEGFETSDGAAVDERREAIESTHVGGRSSQAANRTWEVVWRLSDLAEAVDGLGDRVDDVVVHDWGLHWARAYVIADEEDAEFGASEAPFPEALMVRKVVDEGEGVWPAWTQRLKAELDPMGSLAVGP